jgi:hypothetical protein
VDFFAAIAQAGYGTKPTLRGLAYSVASGGIADMPKAAQKMG